MTLGTTWVGRVDGKKLKPPVVKKPVKSVRFKTEREGTKFLHEIIMAHDPKGVENGEYYIDVDNGEG